MTPDETAKTVTALAAANAEGEHLRRQLATAQNDQDSARRRTRELERDNERLRNTAIEALELVQVLLEDATPYAVRSSLRELRRTG